MKIEFVETRNWEPAPARTFDAPIVWLRSDVDRQSVPPQAGRKKPEDPAEVARLEMDV